MKKLYRSAMFAGVLAFGVAACGDDVIITDPEPTPPPALQVNLTPSNQTIVVGETADFAVGVSGGAAGAQASWTCSSSNSGVASVATTDAGCRATGAAAGNASITVTVTKGNQSSNAGAQVTVTPGEADGVAATVSIGQITKGGLTQPVDIDDVSGQIDVSLNVNPNDQTVTRVEVLVDGVVAAAQQITSGAFEMEAIEDETGEALQVITLSFNTGSYDVDGTANTATPDFLNGEREIQARIFVAEAPSEPAASNVITLNFNNDDGFHVLASAEGNTAVDANGLFWRGGPEFDLTMRPIPVMYTGRVVTDMNANVRVLQAAAPAATERCSANGINREIEDGSDLVFEFSCAGVEAQNFVPYVTTIVAPGETGPSIGGTSLADYAGVLNLTASADHPFPARIDVRAPVESSTGAAIRIVSQTGLDNVGNWVNGTYRFCNGFNRTAVSDGGVGWQTPSSNCGGSPAVNFAASTGTTVATAVAGPAADLRGSDLPEETVTNTALRAWVFVADRLGNQAALIQGTNTGQDVEDGTINRMTFGYDNTAPVLMLSEEEAEAGIFVERYSIVQNTTADDNIVARITDNASGFARSQAARHAVVSVRGAFESPTGATERANVVAAPGAPAPANNTFATVRAGNLITTLAAIPEANLSFDTQTALGLDFGLGAALAGADARYYVYQLQVRDQAGNIVRDYRGIYQNDSEDPTLENLRRPMGFTADAAFELETATDEVEVLEASFAMAYPATGGTVIWERPGAEIVSVLRMNADIQDGELFNDVIFRPNTNISLPLGFADLGLPFIRSITPTEANGRPNTTLVADAVKPTEALARVYSGYGADDEENNHTTVNVAGDGISDFITRIIPTESVSDRNTNWGAGTPASSIVFPGASTFAIVPTTAPDCEAAYCVRALGPASTFTNPFMGGAVLIAYADQSAASGANQWRILGVAEANFSGAFPTRDSGDPNDPQGRLYEWTFDTSGIDIPAGDLALAAIGVRPNGDALLTAFGTVAPDPVFAVAFDPTEAEIDNGVPFTFDVEETTMPPFGFTVQSCAITAASTVAAGTNSTVVVSGGADGCILTAGSTVPGDEITIRAIVESADGDERTIFATATVRDPFVIALAPASQTFDIPNPGDDPIIVDYSTSVVTGGTVSSVVCAITGGAPAGVSVAPFGTFCRVTVTDAAVDATLEVTAVGTEAVTGRTSNTATADLVLEEGGFTIVLEPASTLASPLAISAGDDFEVLGLFTGSRNEASLVGGVAGITCNVVGGTADITAVPSITLGEDGDRAGCTVSVVDPLVLSTIGDDFSVEVDFTTDFGGDVVTTELDAFFEVAPPFTITFQDEGLPNSGFSAAERFSIERNRTHNFLVDGALSSGLEEIDVDASTAVVSPSDGLVTAEISRDGATGPFRVQVTVPLAANTGNYDIVATFVEEGTGRTFTRNLFITVTPTGTIEIGGL